MKCIVTETSPERTNAHIVTNEDGNPHIYATMGEARAELKANGYIYNRSNNRYYLADAPEYRAYIIREDSDEYADAIEQAEQDAAPEYIEPEAIQTISGNTIYRSTDPVTGWNVFTVAGRDFWELAEARYFAQCNPADPEAEAIAATKRAELAATKAEQAQAEAIAARNAGDASAAAQAAHDATTYDDEAMAASLDAYHASGNKVCEAAAQAARRADKAAAAAVRAYYETAESLEAVKAAAPEALEAGDPLAKYRGMEYLELDEPAPVYQRYELEAYLGDPGAYDVEAIEAEATTYDHKTGARVWSAYGDDLAAIAERHELMTYEPAPEAEALEDAAEDAAYYVVEAYARSIGEAISRDEWPAPAAYRVARAEIVGTTTAEPEELEAVAAMVEAIAEHAQASTIPAFVEAEEARNDADAERMRARSAYFYTQFAIECSDLEEAAYMAEAAETAARRAERKAAEAAAYATQEPAAASIAEQAKTYAAEAEAYATKAAAIYHSAI